MEEEEKIDKAFSLLLNEFMEKGNLDLASEIMKQMDNSNNKVNYLESLKIDYPIEFVKIFEKMFPKNLQNQ